MTTAAEPPGADVGGVALRVVLAGACASVVTLLVLDDPVGRVTPWSLVLGTLVVAAVVLAPGSLATTVFLLLVAVLVVDSSPGLLLVPVAVLVHAVHTLAAVLALGPLATRYELRALAPTLRRWLTAQTVVVPVALAAGVVPPPGGVAAGVEVAAALCALVVVAALLVLARRGWR